MSTIILSVVVILVLAAAALGLRVGTRWGSTAAERGREMPGDEFLEGGPPARVAMTRASFLTKASMSSSVRISVAQTRIAGSSSG